MEPGRQSGIPEPGPIGIPFRIFAGVFALVSLLVAAGAVFELVQSILDDQGVRLWPVMIAVTFAFAARYFGCFAFKGRSPRRPPRTWWRTSLDVAFGLAATFTIAYFLDGWLRTSTTPVSTILFVTFILVFARAMRSYWEHGRASVRRHDATQR
jgi:hypothetical protein